MPEKKAPLSILPYMREINVTTDIQFIGGAKINGRATVCKQLLRYPKSK